MLEVADIVSSPQYGAQFKAYLEQNDLELLIQVDVAGLTVHEINGMPAVEAVQAFADEQVFFSKDPAVDFNIALHRSFHRRFLVR